MLETTLAMSVRHLRARSAVISLLCVFACASAVRAQEFSEINQAFTLEREAIPQVGADDFGETINYQTGGMSLTHVDYTSEGIGPPITISRTYRPFFVHSGPLIQIIDWSATNSAADWELNVPRLEVILPLKELAFGVPPVNWLFKREANWVVDNAAPYSRCSNFEQVPHFTATSGDASVNVRPSEWWTGVKLRLPGRAPQELLKRTPENSVVPAMVVDGQQKLFNIATNENWMVTCLPSLKSGHPGEGFLAVDKEGNKYFFDWLSFSGLEWISAQRRVSTYYSSVLIRGTRASLMATRIEDRFGNYISMSYEGNRLIRMWGSDGRDLSLEWREVPWGGNEGGFNVYSEPFHLLTKVTANPGTSQSRSWLYEYELEANGVLARRDTKLRRIVNPDGTKWTYNLDPWGKGCYSLHSTGELSYDCTSGQLDRMASMITPSGLTVTYRMSGASRIRHSATPLTLEQKIFDYDQIRLMALRERHLSGPGLVAAVWRYDMGLNGASTTKYRVTSPDGSISEHLIDNGYRSPTEGRRIGLNLYSDAQSTVPIRTESFEYAEPTGHAYPARIGDRLQPWISPSVEQYRPLRKRTIIQEGVSYTYEVNEFDYFANPRRITRSNSASE